MGATAAGAYDGWVETLLLSPDELLTTTRCVRRHLDLTRPVERGVVEECLAIAQQAPSASNQQRWHFVVVSEAAQRVALAELFRRGWERYRAGTQSSPPPDAAVARMRASVEHLAAHLHDVPIHVIPCVSGRPEGKGLAAQAALWSSILPATWSFMLAARARGLGTCLTTFHLMFEEDAAEILGIPYASVTQAALIPVAYATRTDFHPAARQPLESIVHWDSW